MQEGILLAALDRINYVPGEPRASCNLVLPKHTTYTELLLAYICYKQLHKQFRQGNTNKHFFSP